MKTAAERTVRPHDANALGDLLRARLGRLRLCGTGTRQAQIGRAHV